MTVWRLETLDGVVVMVEVVVLGGGGGGGGERKWWRWGGGIREKEEGVGNLFDAESLKIAGNWVRLLFLGNWRGVDILLASKNA